MAASPELIAEMLRNPPDPNEPLPVSNRPETLFGVIVPLIVLTWGSVLGRLWVRFRVVRDPGWDDFFIVLCCVLNTVAGAIVLKSIDYGLGRHMLYLPPASAVKYFRCFYFENAFYVTDTALFKISLLVQYLRIFKAGYMRWTCLAVLALVSLWGVAYAALAWFPCWPIKHYWARPSNAKCWGYGFSDPKSFVQTFQSHSAANMVFDITIFLMPMILFSKPDLKKRSIMAMVGMFLLGGAVILTSVWRLYTVIESRAATHPYLDFTWWPAISIILSCLEVALAVMCASIPIFWPVIEDRISQIFVTHEIRVSEHRRLDESENENAYELEQTDKAASVKSEPSGRENSEEQLTRESVQVVLTDPFKHYKDEYVVAHVDPLISENRQGKALQVETEVQTGPRQKWKI
ncbi:hypothetical protein BU24DRAFT_395100 [Aaosphaeria arxii CBS 175.79]|uniref:Rhodopsin domain-containing protein n=1 Tax=Aaosphaeria arxii CBS 175.79 TaxID=1450172 RepID=A0A6A5XM07_9PLEO|nr:uncharacterized protein BU24DRAFT_395100 [Aaosphaeria arxii CBS 175.79]KAF2013973.1 hypothetical protein BU24DRAFT_395100 [Aaosphaeria arxii CBS 175.79]